MGSSRVEDVRLRRAAVDHDAHVLVGNLEVLLEQRAHERDVVDAPAQTTGRRRARTRRRRPKPPGSWSWVRGRSSGPLSHLVDGPVKKRCRAFALVDIAVRRGYCSEMLCDRCGSENPDGFRFCGACGAPLTHLTAPASSRSARSVSALFCDLVGFTSRAEAMDPEDVHDLLRTYYASVRARVRALRRNGGEVHRRRGLRPLRRAASARGRSRARGPRRAGRPRRRRGAQRRPPWSRPARSHRRDDRRGADHVRPAARRERRPCVGRHPQHGRPARGGGAAGHDPR